MPSSHQDLSNCQCYVPWVCMTEKKIAMCK
uniref:Uncharacterized protein n=1 Tax=Arundo donax TaxID=35708 RepID=A0A0A9HVL7_ARUDO